MASDRGVADPGGLTTGEIAHDEVDGEKVSGDTVSRIADKLFEEMTEWSNRPLDRIYPALFVDAIIVKVRDMGSTNPPLYFALPPPVHSPRMSRSRFTVTPRA